MKKQLYFFGAVLLVLLISGCRKNTFEPVEPDFVSSQFEEQFDWNTTRIVELEIKSDADHFVQISSVDNKVRYHRGVYQASNGVYSVTLSIPKTVKEIKINATIVTLSDGVMSIHL
ncbi:MAG: hypothetical protein Q8S18_07645 [Bacteroidales bacterium]|nr:hypothetical protein [Bacteroidales bacterium]